MIEQLTTAPCSSEILGGNHETITTSIPADDIHFMCCSITAGSRLLYGPKNG